MRPFGETILKHKMLLEELTNEYRDKLIPVSTAVEAASRAMNFQTAYDFESCLAVMRKAFNVNDGYFVDSADVVPVVHGKWIDENPAFAEYFANCSVCGYEIDVHDERGYSNYCPNCGAKMDGGDEHEID